MSNQTLIPANTMLNIRTIAKTLFEQNYRVEIKPEENCITSAGVSAGLFRVFNLDKPESDCIVCTRGEYSCECEGFNRRGVCRHTEGLVLLVQSQICSYYLRKETILASLKKSRGTWEYEEGMTARATLLDHAAWELECALCDLTGSGEFFLPKRLVGYLPEPVQAERRAA